MHKQVPNVKCLSTGTIEMLLILSQITSPHFCWTNLVNAEGERQMCIVYILVLYYKNIVVFV